MARDEAMKSQLSPVGKLAQTKVRSRHRTVSKVTATTKRGASMSGKALSGLATSGRVKSNRRRRKVTKSPESLAREMAGLIEDVGVSMKDTVFETLREPESKIVDKKIISHDTQRKLQEVGYHHAHILQRSTVDERMATGLQTRP